MRYYFIYRYDDKYLYEEIFQIDKLTRKYKWIFESRNEGPFGPLREKWYEDAPSDNKVSWEMLLINPPKEYKLRIINLEQFMADNFERFV